MNMQPDRALFDADDAVARHEHKSLLRFIVCGSVDHGKSTLIGRLLYESGVVPVDQLQALGEELDFSLLLDGLAAEREQKITIDVAYRFFATARRKYIVADAPGHEQYTRNMATGASTAELARQCDRWIVSADAAPRHHRLDARRSQVRYCDQ
jgi:bifunctional enzyme CysN/CysC